ncbi:MAG TPA: DUF1877 family protein [Kofleriaceae bacterium]|nr:DUF1877 family protein [Kofleriaceae bacterium]
MAHGILITLSPKRLAQIEAEPETIDDVLEARHDTQIPGLLDLGKAWDALDVLLSVRGKDALLGDAVLARTGEELDADGDWDHARVLAPARVAEIATRLAALPPTVVSERYATLAGMQVHGGLGKDPGEIEALELILRRLVALYQDAARQKHSMLALMI